MAEVVWILNYVEFPQQHLIQRCIPQRKEEEPISPFYVSFFLHIQRLRERERDEKTKGHFEEVELVCYNNGISGFDIKLQSFLRIQYDLKCGLVQDIKQKSENDLIELTMVC